MFNKIQQFAAKLWMTE